jgi:hypothetical protein
LFRSIFVIWNDPMSIRQRHAITRYTGRLPLSALLIILFLAACSSSPPSVTEGQSELDYGAMLTAPEDPVLLGERVKPVLDSRTGSGQPLRGLSRLC